MNILVINHYAGSKAHGMEYRPFYLAREWTGRGHRVTIVASSSSHLRTVHPAIRGDYTAEDIDGIRYVWLRTPDYRGNGVRRVLNMGAFVGQLLRHRTRIIRDSRPDVVIASSTYPLDNVPARLIATAAEARLVYEVHDLWPLTPVELGGMSPRHPFILLMQWAEDFAYRKADRVISMLPYAAEHMLRHGMAPHKFVHIPNGIDPAEWQDPGAPIPPEHGKILARLKAQGRFILGYTGAHGIANALTSFVDSAQLLQTQPVTLVLVGQGPEKEALQQRAQRMGLDNIIFLPPVPKASIQAILAAMDACFIGWSRKPIYRFGVSPNKLFDYMMAGRPVIHAVESPGDLVAASNCGVSIPPEHPQAIADAILRLMALSPAEREAMGLRGREYVLAHHDYQILARRFLESVSGRTEREETAPRGDPAHRDLAADGPSNIRVGGDHDSQVMG